MSLPCRGRRRSRVSWTRTRSRSCGTRAPPSRSPASSSTTPPRSSTASTSWCPPPRPLSSLPLLSVSGLTHLIYLLWKSQGGARSGLWRGGSPNAAAHAVHLQVMTIINPFSLFHPLIFNSMFVCPLRQCRAIQICLLYWANDSYLSVALPHRRN